MYFMAYLLVFGLIGIFNLYYAQGLMKLFAWLMDKGIVPYYEMDFRFEGHLRNYLFIAEIVIFVVGYLLYSHYSYKREQGKKESNK